MKMKARNRMSKHIICLVGCDDATEVEMEMTDEELEFLRNVARKVNNKSSCECMPTLYIDDVKEK